MSQLHPRFADLAPFIEPPRHRVADWLAWQRRVELNEYGAVIAGGLYGLSFEKMMIDTLGQSLEAETHKEAMVLDAHTPDFTLDDFFDDIDNEVSGTGYTTGGVVCTGTEITLSGGLLTFDMIDTVFTTVTITDAMAGVFYTLVGSAATDQLIVLQDFVTAASSTAANFTIQHAGGGVFTLDYTP